MKMTNNLLAINLLQVLMIFYKVWVTLDQYFASGGKDTVAEPLPVNEPVPATEPEQIFLKYSLIGLSLVLVSIPICIIVITKRRKSKSNQSSSSSGDHSLLDLSYDERWDYIKQKEEEIKKEEKEKIATIESKVDEISAW